MVKYIQRNGIISYVCILRICFDGVVLINCGVMKFLADMPSCLEGEDNRINEV